MQHARTRRALALFAAHLLGAPAALASYTGAASHQPINAPAPDARDATPAPRAPAGTSRPAPAAQPSAATFDGVYRHQWRSPDGEWMQIGLMSVRQPDAGARPVPAPIGCTYIGRDTALPERIEVVKHSDRELHLRLVFPRMRPPEQDGGEARDLVLEYPFTRDAAGVLEAPVMLDGKEVARTRLEPLPDEAAVLAELRRTLEQIEVEKAVSQSQVPPLRDGVKFWLRQMEEDRRMGRSTTGTMTRMQLTASEGALGAEEARLGKIEAFERACRELIVRLEATQRPRAQ